MPFIVLENGEISFCDIRLQVLSLIVEEVDVQKLQLSVFPVPDMTAMKFSKMIRGKLDYFL